MIERGVESMVMIALNVSNLVGEGMESIIAELLLCAQLLSHAGCWLMGKLILRGCH